ncbi:hypothetical protein EG329_012294 [Mollisiaceae sp. DMI_Dod_QoI]|nr:hypothetical protein EG329_012294 [Helotiales sp. DMI_Dod_QoI]
MSLHHNSFEMSLSVLRLVIAVLFLILTTAFLRASYILSVVSRQRQNKSPKSPKVGPSHMVIVLGSGGHTAEMMSLLRDIDPRRYFHRTYIVSSGDSFSTSKAHEIERTIQLKYRSSADNPTEAEEFDSCTGIWDVKVVPRARKIHQPLYTTPFSSIWCLVKCLHALHSTAKTSRAAPGEYPDVIITNGPATAVIVILAAAILKFFAIVPLNKMKTIYVESWARVRTLSLSGKILLRAGICDRFLVQWEILAKSINGNSPKQKVEWVGFLVA